jgi:hypothetical protein
MFLIVEIKCNFILLMCPFPFLEQKKLCLNIEPPFFGVQVRPRQQAYARQLYSLVIE